MIISAILFTVVVGSYYSPAWAQVVLNNTSVSTNLTATMGTKYVGVEVLFESPQTLILQGQPIDVDVYGVVGSLWEAVDLAKKSGYSIDAVAQVTEESSAVGNTRYLTPVYTIFFSK